MQRNRGFTLIELMIVLAIVAILAAVGYPSYRNHVAKGQRSAGQQYLSDVAQRQEQYLLDRRQYATTLGPGATGLGMRDPQLLEAPLKYTLANDFAGGVNNGTTPPSFTICLEPLAGSPGAQRGDGRLCINNLGQRWREAAGGNGAFDAASDCAWDNSSCRIAGEQG